MIIWIISHTHARTRSPLLGLLSEPKRILTNWVPFSFNLDKVFLKSLTVSAMLQQALLCVTFAMTSVLIPACHSALCLFTIIHPTYLSIHSIASQSLKQSTTCAHAPKISYGGSRAYRPVNTSGINKINPQIRTLLQISTPALINSSR